MPSAPACHPPNGESTTAWNTPPLASTGPRYPGWYAACTAPAAFWRSARALAPSAPPLAIAPAVARRTACASSSRACRAAGVPYPCTLRRAAASSAPGAATTTSNTCRTPSSPRTTPSGSTVAPVPLWQWNASRGSATATRSLYTALASTASRARDRGKVAVLSAIFYDASEFIQVTWWGDDATTMAGAIKPGVLYELANCTLQAADNFQVHG